MLSDISSLYHTIDADKGISYGMRGLELAKKMNWPLGMANCYYSVAYNEFVKSDYLKATTFNENALKFYSQIHLTSGTILALTLDAYVYYNKSDYPKALDYYVNAEKLAEKINSVSDEAVCFIGIGKILMSQGNYSESLEYLNKGLAIYEKIKNEFAVMNTFSYIGTVYFNKSDFNSALKFHHQALKKAEELKNKKGIAENMVSIGNIYSEESNNAEALKYQFGALKLYQELNNNGGIANILGNIGITYLMIASDSNRIQVGDSIDKVRSVNLKKAIEYLQKSIALENVVGELNSLQQFHENLSEAYAIAGEHKEAYDNLKLSNVIKDSIFSVEKAVKMSDIQKAYELEKQKEIDKIKAAEDRRDKIFYALGVALLLLIVGLVGRGYTTQKKLNRTITKLVDEQEQTIKERTADLAISNEKLAVSNNELAQYNQELFNLIQFNAHNIREPLTRITGAMMLQEFLDKEEFHTEIWPLMHKAAHDLDNTIKEVINMADNTLKLHEKPQNKQ